MKTETIKVKVQPRNAKGQLQAGNTAAANSGRPKLGNMRLEKLLQAIQRVENKTNKNLLDYYIERSFKSDSVLCSVMKKLMPDLQAVAYADFGNEMSDELAAGIQQKLQKRFEQHNQTDKDSKIQGTEAKIS